ncbi:hypothetical protein ACPEIC_05710 [Stenotrophomonas sp. NPDC087984]
MDRCDSERAGPIPGVQSADEVPGIGKAQPTCLRQSTALAPGPPGQSRQRPDQRDRGGPLAQHVLLRQGDRHLRFGPFHLRRAGRHPPGHDRVEDIAVVGNLLAPGPLGKPCHRRLVHDVHTLLGGGDRPELRRPPAGTVRHPGTELSGRPAHRSLQCPPALPAGIGASDRVEVQRQGQQ